MAIKSTAKKITVKASKAAAPAQPAARKAASPAPVITLKQLAAELAAEHGMEKRDAQTLLTDVVGMLVQHLKAGDRLRMAGLGVLEIKDRPARAGRNPATGEVIQIAASRKVAFRAAKELKEAL